MRLPVSANTAAKPAVNVLSRSRIRNRNWVARSPRSMSAEVQEQVAGLLGHPGAGGMGGDPGDVHAAAAVLDHSQDVEAAEEDGVDVGEVERKDLVGLRGEQPSAGRSGPWRAGSMPAAFKIFQTVEAATAWPSPRSSPWIRR
jgi:hypothetical protein